MTATHHCKVCGRKTTHIPGKLEIPKELGLDETEIDALRCVVCGTIVSIVVEEKTE